MKKIFSVLACAFTLLLASCAGSSQNLFDGSQDVGSVKFPGSMTYDATTDTYTVSASGENMWFGTDAYYMVWKKVTGDFELSGDIEFEGEGTNPHRKMGFIIRENLEPDAPYADIAVHGDGLTSLQYRDVKGADAQETGNVEGKAPTTIYLSRQGNKIAIRSGKGSLPETNDAEIDLTLPAECYVGLYLCSHEDSIVETGRFRHVVLK